MIYIFQKKVHCQIKLETNSIYTTNANTKKELSQQIYYKYWQQWNSPIPNATILKKKDNQIASVPEKELRKNTKSNNNSNKIRNHPANVKFIDQSSYWETW